MGNESSHRYDGLTISGDLAFEGVGGALSVLNRDSAAHTARQVAAMRALGYYAETYPVIGSASGATAGTTGRVYFNAIGLLEGDVVSSICARVSTGGSGFSGIGLKLGLYSSGAAVTLLASTADDSTAYGSTGPKKTAVTTPFTCTYTGLYYVAILSVASTPPALIRGTTGVAGMGAMSGGSLASGTQSSQTDLPAAATIVVDTSQFLYWHGVA